MKILFLGTSSADWYPAPWCNCENCSLARKYKGKDIRRYSCILIDSDLLIDLPPDIVISVNELGVNLTRVKAILITHPHGDHFAPGILEMRREPSTINGELTGPRMTEVDEIIVAGSEGTIQYLVNSISRSLEELKIRAMVLKPFVWYKLLESTNVLPLPAYHMVGTNAAFIYVIERNNKRILYAVDTGYPREEVMKVLENLKFDAIICEATLGLGKLPEEAQHMNVELASKLRQHLIEKQVITTNTPFILTHVSPHWMPPYHKVHKKLEEMGFILAYDGFIIEI